MSKILKNSLLNYISQDFFIEKNVNQYRIFEYNKSKIKSGSIVYLIEREIRAKDNFALQFALQKSKELNKPLYIIYHKINYDFELKQKFIDEQIKFAQKDFSKINFELKIFEGSKIELLNILKKLRTSIIVVDFNPILNRQYLLNADFMIYETDGHNIIPARFLSQKQEYSAFTIRRKIYFNLQEFLTEFDNSISFNNKSELVLKEFIEEKLPYYAEFKNNPAQNVLSGLSKYLNLGFISSQRVALEVIKSNVSTENKEAFLEELIVRKELADNFCLYCNSFKSLDCIPFWAKQTLIYHQNDFRPYLYSQTQFEFAQTHDKLWNACQTQLLEEGIIHGYLRMYWAKQILKWTKTPQEALKIAIYLNDKYAFDAPSANGYVGILWSIGALHDRAFQDRPITGKIRTMTFNSIKTKFNIQNYLDKFIKD